MCDLWNHTRTAAHLRSGTSKLPCCQNIPETHSHQPLCRRWKTMKGTKSSSSSSSLLVFFLLAVSCILVDNVSSQTTTVPPTVPPTRVPTRAPISSPTSSPSVSLSPSFAPTSKPNTQGPTRQPTGWPTRQPTRAPTSAPTTAVPTAVPTSGPTLAPIIGTRSPVVATNTPTIEPTQAPTELPTTAPTLTEYRFDIPADMQLRTMAGSLTSGQRIDWEFKTAAHIKEVIEKIEMDDPLFELSVTTDTAVQTVINTGGGTRRHLQGSQSFILKVEFVVRVTFRAAKGDRKQVAAWIREAFNTPEERNRYISRLQGTNDPAFASVEGVQVGVDGQAPPPDDLPTPTEKESNDIILYIIAAGGGGCALVVVGLVFLYCTRNSRNPPKKRKGDEITTSGSNMSPAGLAAEIIVRNNDDVSTLGDPVQITTQPTPDEQTASIGTYGPDYDYSHEYRRAHGIGSDNGSLERNESVGSRTANSASLFSSENSLDFMLDGDPRYVYRFEVTVPPGKLGIVMDNSPSGTPMVFAVKPESVLARDVQVGDRLLAVDQEDVTVMSAIQVSKLISLKNDQDRTLTFCRKRSSGKEQDM
uniref:PDZ domain-containing protein n=1 Tax=Amphora coffeiformis TaxID=265554 RepID=A0A7S3L1A3_9STRA